jgi:hypothetical protein
VPIADRRACLLVHANTLQLRQRHGEITIDWTVDHAGWVISLMEPEEQTFYGRTLSEGLA